MNILILTGRFGMGHYSAAAAIKEELIDNKTKNNIIIVDIIEHLLPNTCELVYKSYNTVVSKWSDLYNLLNKISSNYGTTPFEKLLVNRMEVLFEKYSPDIIISTLPMSSKWISEYKALVGCTVPLVTCITDISSNEEWITSHTDVYFVGSHNLKEELIKKSVEDEKIFITGIPVKKAFKNNKGGKNSGDVKHVLIMGGGLGLIPLSDQLLSYFDRMPSVKATVITGNNKKMYEELKGKYKSIDVIGYTDEVWRFMSNSNLVISKAGGITLFEAINSETPIFVIKPFLQQEICNAHFIENERIGKVVWNKKGDILEQLYKFIEDDYEILNMKNNMAKIKNDINKISINSIIYSLTAEGKKR